MHSRRYLPLVAVLLATGLPPAATSTPTSTPALIPKPVLAPEPVPGPRQRGEDFDAMWRAIERGHAYLWPKEIPRAALAADRARAVAAADRGGFVAALERSLERLRDEHVGLSEASPGAPRSVPAETDVWPAWRDGRAMVEAVRTYGDADMAGLRPGDRIVRIDGVPVERAVRQRLARGEDGEAALQWALRHALAGPRSGTLRLDVAGPGAARTVSIERSATAPQDAQPVMARRIGEARDLGYLRIRGALTAPVAAQARAALDSLRGTRALIVDLRDAHGDGGRAQVEAILARFAVAPAAWRLREDRHGRRVTDTLRPAGNGPRVPVLVLVDRWTAGDGEALAAGLAAVAHARLVGTRMAGMRGELREALLPHSGIRVRFPGERVLHVDGTPRERLRPAIEVDLAAPKGGPGDPILYQALKSLEK